MIRLQHFCKIVKGIHNFVYTNMITMHDGCEEVVQTINCSSHTTHIIMIRVLKEYFYNQHNEI